MAKLTGEERLRLEILRRKSFRSGYLMPDEMKFLSDMFAKSPEEYRTIGETVKNEEVQKIRGWK